MSSAQATIDTRIPEPARQVDPVSRTAAAPRATGAVPTDEARRVLDADQDPSRETFIPVTRFALMDRLTLPQAWPKGMAREARRLFRYLDYWRRQQYAARILELEQAYEPFSPDTDLLLTRKFTEAERHDMQRRVVTDMKHLLAQANYKRIDPNDVSLILTRESHYGLDLHVDFSTFEEVLIYYRGATNWRDHRSNLKKFMRKEEFDVPIFQRLFLLFKLKPFEVRVREVMQEERVSLQDARKIVTKRRSMLPEEMRDDNIYMKLFKNIPRTDLEMVFPNTVVKFRMFDKVKLGATSSVGLGMGVASSAGKLALLFSNPIAEIGRASCRGRV